MRAHTSAPNEEYAEKGLKRKFVFRLLQFAVILV